MPTELASNSAPANTDNTSLTNVREKFLFECDHLVMFCTNQEKSNAEEQTDTLLEVKLEDLDNRWRRLQETYEKLMLATEPANTKEFRENAKINFNASSEAYYVSRSRIIDLLRLYSNYIPRDDRGRRTSIGPQTVIQTQIGAEASNVFIKVPPCDTEEFSGGYEEWPPFRDMFTAVYANHPKLTRAQKLYHLRNKTKGSAGAIVKRFPLCDDNFDLAWNALKNRYENKRVLVDNQLKMLFNISVATTEDSTSIQQIQATVSDCLATLETLQVDVSSWDPILIYLVSTKLPEVTLSLWEQSLKSHKDLPRWSQMNEFLTNRFEIVERIGSIRATKDRLSLPAETNSRIHTYASQEQLHVQCKLCNEDHSLRACPSFKSFSAKERVDFVFQNKVCNNCLSSAHLKSSCKSKHSCLVCKKKHHTLLHMHNQNVGLATNTSNHPATSTQLANAESNIRKDSEIASTSTEAQFKSVHANHSSNYDTILLRTALVYIKLRGELFQARALIDPGSQRTFISERMRSRLQIPTRKSHVEINGIGGQTQTASQECEFTIASKKHDTTFTITAIVLPKVTKHLPTISFEIPNSNELDNIDLADPHFNRSSPIDLILGNDSERFINLNGIKKNLCGLTSAYNTIFGWVLSGPVKTEIRAFTTSVASSEDTTLNNLIRKFWELEEVPESKPSSDEDKFCEELYLKTTKRQPDGRYMVRLPFKEPRANLSLGSSRHLALAQYIRMEQTLSKDNELKEQYNAVLHEYLTLGHMDECPSRENESGGNYSSFYLPHHAVVRPEHKTTKVRVVFNASRKTKSGLSLNDVLHTGPTLQNDLTSVIINWRQYRYVFGGDITKMYRQILVDPQDRPFQRILLRTEANGPIKDFQLNTVTFGVNCAPYLAIRTLLKLASDIESQYPTVSKILRKETYVDDILSGGHNLKSALIAQSELICTLDSAGFPLRKITANDPALLSNLPVQNLYDENFLKIHETSSTKVLGIKWNAKIDSFTYSYSPLSQYRSITKRKALSAVAQLYDPVGWITPVIIRAKIFMQELWLEGCQWDEEISSQSLQKWNALITDISDVEKMNIPRWIQYTPSDRIQIHGFSDASKTAYCAAIYIRSQSSNNAVFSHLIIAKSKVAPLKTICLPRLELNGAVLLAKLVHYVVSTLDIPIAELFLWTDSSIVLGWLSKPPRTWETYVANRSAQIHELVPKATWRHVPTSDNPADLGTRGCKPADLAENSQWWNGPLWLRNAPTEWPMRNPLSTPNIGKEVQTLHVASDAPDILTRFSSYHKALRVLAYAFRFLHHGLSKYRSTKSHQTLNLSQKEAKFVKTRLIVLSQKKFYSTEYKAIKENMPIPDKSPLKPLNPFIDKDEVLRVNGRLTDSSLPYNERYPIILPGNSHLCHIYLLHLHNFLVHGECSQMCRMVQTEFFISRLKPRIKSIIYKCKICTIYKQKACQQLMAPLPPERCELTPPFHTTGIDFAGPLELKGSSLRKAPLIKGYICVFVCFSTKAIHLEVCSDLSSAAFEATFARFVGRRGLPRRVVSDNGRNFVGASRNLLKEFQKFINTVPNDVAQKYSSHGFEWCFIPPYAPHMGGLWEAAVKSFKYHLKRIAGSHKFTFEEMTTLLARIEGVLNSRPISAISEDPFDLTALTPGHFLKGAPIVGPPEPLSDNLCLTNKWEKIKALHHQFSIRWKEDYLKSLHKRYKWKNSVPNIGIGDLVVVMDDLLPPSEWRLGRVEDTHSGSDDNVRVVTIQKLPKEKPTILPMQTVRAVSLNTFLSTISTNDSRRTETCRRAIQILFKLPSKKSYQSILYFQRQMFTMWILPPHFASPTASTDTTTFAETTFAES